MLPNYLILGLGNPGPIYQKTRHNIGQEFVRWLQQQNQFSPWHQEKKYYSQLSIYQTPQQKIILALPLVFMNETGRVIDKLTKYFDIPLKNIIVVHDDNDINVGEFKLSFNYGSAGHKGVNSIIKTLKSQNFYRLRIGIQPKTTVRQKAGDLVLKKFSPEERKIVTENFVLMKKALEEKLAD